MLLRINNLEKEFGKNDSYQKVLDNISIEFKSGEFICLLGESGSGKSTFLNVIGGLDGKEELTQKEVASVLGISQSYISRIEKKVIKEISEIIKI